MAIITILVMQYIEWGFYIIIIVNICSALSTKEKDLRPLAKEIVLEDHSMMWGFILECCHRMQFQIDLLEALSDRNDCGICLQKFDHRDRISLLKCNPEHYFHSRCLEDWTWRRESNKCPECN